MDTLDGGKWLNDQDLAWTLVTARGRASASSRDRWGCFFDRNPDGTIHQKAFAGQTFDRTVHKGDLTGIEIVNRLAEQVWARGIQPAGGTPRGRADARSRTGRACGRAARRHAHGRASASCRRRPCCWAPAAGRPCTSYHTPSGDKACDGMAMALRAGLALRDMEMVQFHPTGVLAGPGTRMTGTIIEEGLRGAGGYLLGGDGQRFMDKYDPRGERATRDIVSRSMQREILAGNVNAEGGAFWIEMDHLGPGSRRARVQGHGRTLRRCGFDLAGGRVPVVPTAHYMMGGVGVPRRTGATACPGSSPPARTPAACMARIASAATAWRIPRCSAASPATRSRAGCAGTADGRARRGRPRGRRRACRGAAARPRLRAVARTRGIARGALHGHVGRRGHRARCGGTRARARTRSPTLRTSSTVALGLQHDGRAREFNLAWHDVLNLANLTAVSQVIVRAAQARENSRGAHFRSDFEAPGDDVDVHAVARHAGRRHRRHATPGALPRASGQASRWWPPADPARRALEKKAAAGRDRKWTVRRRTCRDFVLALPPRHRHAGWVTACPVESTRRRSLRIVGVRAGRRHDAAMTPVCAARVAPS